MSQHRVTIDIGEDNYKFLAATARLAGITPKDMLSAAWKIGAAAYAAQAMGYQLPPSLTGFTPDSLARIFRDFLAKYGGEADG